MIVKSVSPMRRALLCTVTLLTLAACSGDGPQVPTVSTANIATSVQSTVATAVGTVPVVTVTDAKGRAIKGVLVHWKVNAGGGRVVNDTVRTTATGDATSGGWTLGTTAGTQILQALVDGIAPATFTAEAAPGPATRVTRLSPDAQQATVNTAVAVPPTARVEDDFGNPVPAVAVTFTVSNGNGTISGAQTTSNSSGVASASGWTLGTASGQQTARATIANAAQASFSATAVAGAPVDIMKFVGDNQAGLSSAPISTPPGVRITDEFGNGVGNVPVTFSPGANSGSVTGGVVLTDPATGTAFVGNWVLGTNATQTLLASSTRLPNKTITFSATAVTSQYNIDVRFIGDGGTQQQRDAFTRAAAKWRRIIVGHVHTTPLNAPAGDCDTWIPAINETVSDLVIFARIRPIDGVGKILAQAGPCAVSTSSNLSLYGLMEFDQDDMPGLIANGTIDDVVLHEMGHVLGIGTLWNFRRNLLTGSGSTDPFFSGVRARAEFANLPGSFYTGTSVPVENSGGAGTRDSHWRATVFGRELMQGYARAGGMPLSKVTAASLADLGYQVLVSNADPFSLASALRKDAELVVSLENDIADIPLKVVDSRGNQTLIRPSSKKE